MNIKIDDLANEIARKLADYSQDVTDVLKKEVKQVAKECLEDIKNNSPVQTGSYKKGWAVKNSFESNEDIRQTVHNRTDYQLTHLLENGHLTASGGNVNGIPHIAPAEKTAADKLFNSVKVAIKR